MLYNFPQCPACYKFEIREHPDTHIIERKGIEYVKCWNCNTIFSEMLDNSDKVGGNEEISRNLSANNTRVERVKYMLSFTPAPHFVLDYGCGHGYLVNDLDAIDHISAFGYDKYDPRQTYIPDIKFDMVTMVEVIEHMSAPFEDLQKIYELLKPGGFIMIETSFTDVADELGIQYEDFEYIDPYLGHCTIFSHKGLDIVMRRFNFVLDTIVNRNVRIYRKVLAL